MSGIRLFGLRLLFAWLFLLILQSQAQAGFQWLEPWRTTGDGRFLGGLDLPNGVSGVGGSIQNIGGYVGNDPPMDRYFSESIVVSRPFSLGGSPGGWRIDLELETTHKFQVTNHMIFEWGPDIRVNTNLRDPFPMPLFQFIGGMTILRILDLPDGDYWLQFGIQGRLRFATPPPGTQFGSYSGFFRYDVASTMKVTAVPEPASGLIIGQGLFAAAGVMVFSKRRKPGSGSLRSTEPNEILDRFETPVIKGVRS